MIVTFAIMGIVIILYFLSNMNKDEEKREIEIKNQEKLDKFNKYLIKHNIQMAIINDMIKNHKLVKIEPSSINNYLTMSESFKVSNLIISDEEDPYLEFIPNKYNGEYYITVNMIDLDLRNITNDDIITIMDSLSNTDELISMYRITNEKERPTRNI